ncbi:MAG: glycosyltransferase family 4 protein [Anaerolineales bacterium]|nr:glycosyltransferase family 4 protein [Anaerolineales bacterium]
MRALFLTNFYPPYIVGGYELWCQEVAEGMKARGHAVEVLTSTHGVKGPLGQEEGITRTLHLMTDIDYYKPVDFFLHWQAEEAANREAVTQAIARFAPDVVLVWGMWNLSLTVPAIAEKLLPGALHTSCRRIGRATSIRILLSGCCRRGKARRWVKLPLRAAAMHQLQRAGYPPQLAFEHVVCCSEYVRTTLVAAGQLPASAGVLLGGTDPKPFVEHSACRAPLGDRPVELLFFGRLIHDKGAHTALEAMGILRQNGVSNVRLTVLGSGHPDYEAHLHRHAETLGIQDEVTFLRQVARDEIPALLSRFDIYLFTSIWAEPMARSVMEAMASGLLVIGTTVGGQAEMVSDGENALTFVAGDSEGLAHQIKRAVDDPALCRRLAMAGQQLVLERFTLERMVDDIEALLTDIVADVATAGRVP